MAKTKKFYTVWKGRNAGVYTTWDDCKQEVNGFAGAKYKSFESEEMALKALSEGWEKYVAVQKSSEEQSVVVSYKDLPESEQPILESIAVDAACSGNPGVMEYRGVDVLTNYEIFRLKPTPNGTNNIGEFLAIVHALALFSKSNPDLIIYTDSVTALSWVRKKKCGSKLEENSGNSEVFSLIRRAELWLANNTFSNQLLKWDTPKWGEIPADFGRK